MCPKVKRYKGKEMGTFRSTKMRQNVCLERHRGSEEKVKKVLRNIGGAEFKGVRELEAQGLHLGFFVDVVFPRVAEAILEAAGFGSKGPDQALPGGEGLWLLAEGLILKGERGIDPLPARGLEGLHNVGEHKCVQGVVVDEERVAYVAAKDVHSELAVESGAIEKMCDEIVAIGLDVEFGFSAKAVRHALV